MTTASGEKPLELSVRNFGPIAEADIELRPLSVFVGPSNTGKSYLATLIYALHRFFGGFSGPAIKGPDYYAGTFPHAQSALRRLLGVDISAEEIQNLYAWVSAERHKSGAINQSGRLSLKSDLPGPIWELIGRAASMIEQSNEALENEIARCFGIRQSASLLHFPSGDTTILSISCDVARALDDSRVFVYQVELADQGAGIKSKIPMEMPFEVGIAEASARVLVAPEDPEDERPLFARFQLAALAGEVLSCSVGPLGRPARYLPADRAGAVRSHQALVSALIADASDNSTRAAPQQPTFSGIYGDFLRWLVSLGNLPKQEPQAQNTLATSMEKEILSGKILIESNLASYPSFFYRPRDWDHDIPLMNASSMVSELAPVVLYLRHVVQPGETLIIEEPESALHPAMQVELTRVLADAVKKGIRIIITTHSEWVLEELANLVLMSDLPEDRREGLEGTDMALSSKDVGVWFFEPSESATGGTVVKGMPLDREMGTFPSGFGLVTHDQYNRWAEISSRVENGG